MMQAPGSRIPPLRAAIVSDDLYKPCACLHKHYATGRHGSARPKVMFFWGFF